MLELSVFGSDFSELSMLENPFSCSKEPLCRNAGTCENIGSRNQTAQLMTAQNTTDCTCGKFVTYPALNQAHLAHMLGVRPTLPYTRWRWCPCRRVTINAFGLSMDSRLW